jgi:hypothetical protein
MMHGRVHDADGSVLTILDREPESETPVLWVTQETLQRNLE